MLPPVSIVLPLTGTYRVLVGAAVRSVLVPVPVCRRNTPNVYQAQCPDVLRMDAPANCEMVRDPTHVQFVG
jgi:hypothetical protein